MKSIKVCTLQITEKKSKRVDTLRFINPKEINLPYYLSQEVSKEILERIEKGKSPKKNYTFKNSLGNKEITVKYTKNEYSIDSSSTIIIELFHESLRKHCDTPSAWALWCWINFCADNKEFHNLIHNFWSLLIASYEEMNFIIKNRKLNLKEEKIFSEVQNTLTEYFLQNMEEVYVRGKDAPLNNSNVRYQWTIGKALIQGCLNNKDLEHCSYSVFTNQYKHKV